MWKMNWTLKIIPTNSINLEGKQDLRENGRKPPVGYADSFNPLSQLKGILPRIADLLGITEKYF